MKFRTTYQSATLYHISTSKRHKICSWENNTFLFQDTSGKGKLPQRGFVNRKTGIEGFRKPGFWGNSTGISGKRSKRFQKTLTSFGVNAYFFQKNLPMFFHITRILPGRKPKSDEDFSGCYFGTNKTKTTNKRIFGTITVYKSWFPPEATWFYSLHPPFGWQKRNSKPPWKAFLATRL